uniref:Putative capsid protein n=1 Tax=Atrato Partiti-like virus 2 TaxID=2689327 RepID=A0A6B9KNI5_9VIRU|nr:putative capsid protein [Atrato Partiti-like virus 2]
MDPKMIKMFEQFQRERQQGTAETSAPKRNNASWSKTKDHRQKRSGIPKTNVGNPVRNPNPPGAVPPGQYLSKTATELMNDPLSEKAYFPTPSSAFMACATKEKIHSGATLLPALQDETYNQVSAANPSYAKTVPKSAHDYYVGVVTFARLVSLHMKSGGKVTADEYLFLAQMAEYGFTVPKSLSLFLAGFGDTKLPSGRELSFTMTKPESVIGVVTVGGVGYQIPGYFGAIEHNLGTYSSYPCLGVYMQRLLQDLLHPENQAHPTDWDLPETLRMEGKPINHNCIGYSPSVRLAQEQRSFLFGAGVANDRFDFAFETIPIMYELLVAIHMKLSASRMTLFPISNIRLGSVGQVPVESVVGQTTQRMIGAQFIARTAFDLPASEGYLGSSFLYNVDKGSTELRILKSMMPVRYRPHDPVTAQARLSLNQLFVDSTPLVKNTGFETIGFSPLLRLGEIIKVENAT